MKFTNRLSLLTISIGVILFAFTSCDTTNNNSGRNARLKVQLTDAPGDFDAVFIDIQSVRVHLNEDAETDSTESDEEAEKNGFITINQDPIRVNLLDLSNGNAIQLGNE